MPTGELALEPPPEPERVVPAGLLARLLPLVMLLGSVGFIVVLGVDQPTSWLFGGMFVLSTLGMVLTGGGRGGGARTAAVDEERRDYLRYLAGIRRRVRQITAAQRAALEATHPDPAAWPAVLADGRLWERGPADPDFGAVRIGRGAQRLATRLIAPSTGPLDGIEPVTALALRRFLRAHAVVDDLPVALALPASSTVWLEAADPAGTPRPTADSTAPARAMARAVLVQYALWHSPADARLAVVAPPHRLADWDWVKWLPHTGHPRRRDATGPLRTVGTSTEQVRRWWSVELTGRAQGAGVGEPHLLLVVDHPAATVGPWAAAAGVTVLRVGAPMARRPGPAVVRLVITTDRVRRVGADGTATVVGEPDTVELSSADAFARRMARYRPAGTGPAAVDGADGGRGAGLPTLLGLRQGPAGIRALRTRWARTEADRLRVPLGTDEHGAPVLLDLKESAHGGSGPHGLCVGATGSGKSELLRSLVLGLVAAHPPAELNLVLVDFKGGATFLGMAGLPHVSAVITNLADELDMVDRMVDALAGEINRRQELLRAAGNLVGVGDYAAARRAGADLAPLPALLVVVDEFSELLAQRPELGELLVTIGRLGRSLGLHLLLASQRLDEGRLRGLESHLSYRIALRTFSAAESRAVLGVPDAHRLPPAPGSAFLSTGTDELIRFRAAYVSGPAPRAAPSGADPAVVRRAWPFGIAPVLPSDPVPDPDRPSGGDRDDHRDDLRDDPRQGDDGDEGEGDTVLDTVLAAVDACADDAGSGGRAHRVWLPPLGPPPPLDEVLGACRVRDGRPTVSPTGPLHVGIGLIDRPFQQRRDPLRLDLAAGHVVIAGAPRSGRSTALATLVLALALTHPPAAVGVHVLDFGGGVLTGLAALPHVGTVVDRQRPELVRRTLAELGAAVRRRELLFRAAGLTSVEQFRSRRAAGEFPDEPATDLLLVLDGHHVLRAEFTDLEDQLQQLAAHGLGLGVHLAVSVGRWSELRPALKDLLGGRVELRLGDPGDSEVDRRRAARVPARPGHALAADGAAAVVAAPHLVGQDTVTTMAVVTAAWPGEGFAPVRVLPERITPVELGPPAGPGLPVGIDEAGLDTVTLDLAAESHLLHLADAESGKTALLRLLAAGIVARHPPEQARIVLVDPRRTLLGEVPASHLIGYASTTEEVGAAAEIAASLRRRLPHAGVGAEELRERSWWHGPEVYLLVDDYDLVVPGGGAVHPLLALVEFLPLARDVGLHVVLARRCGGAARALYDPVLGRLRELGALGLVGSGNPEEGTLLGGVRPEPLPPGRVTLVDRRRGARRLQLAWVPPEADR